MHYLRSSFGTVSQ
ncbi:UNVERIFIED_CONTAM: hypothetical protein GTU68_006179 [Idotea baltica]|nr:hypothetical protein [Idotea baltica]